MYFSCLQQATIYCNIVDGIINSIFSATISRFRTQDYKASYTSIQKNTENNGESCRIPSHWSRMSTCQVYKRGTPSLSFVGYPENLIVLEHPMLTDSNDNVCKVEPNVVKEG